MATVVNGSIYPPDNSGKWHDDGWGGWTDDPSYYKKIPDGYFNCWGNIIIPEKSNPTLDSKTEKSVLKTLDEAKTFENTKVGRLMGQILVYGNAFVDLLVRARIIKNVSADISLNNIDEEELDRRLNNGELKRSTQVTAQTTTPPKPTNSTFFGIDLSNPLNVVLLVISIFGLVKILTPSTSK